MLQQEFVNRIISLVKKHGDRVVLADQETGEAVVVMDLAQYEQLLSGSAPAAPAKTTRPNSQTLTEEQVMSRVGEAPPPVPRRPAPARPAARPEEAIEGLTKDEFIDKLTRDIGSWKNAQDRQRTEELRAAVKKPAPPPESALEDEERFYLEPIE